MIWFMDKDNSSVPLLDSPKSIKRKQIRATNQILGNPINMINFKKKTTLTE